jgi:trimeric autotransporter adhesin
MGIISRPNPPKKLTTKDILRLLQILFHIPSKRSMGLVEREFGICRTCSRLELYDVKFGGIERMTKRLTIALVALALFVLVVMVPVSATKISTGPNYYYEVTRNIAAGSTIFIGEEKLNLQPPLVEGTVVGYWASAANAATTPPSKTVSLTSVTNYTVTASDYGIGGSIADWYVVNPATGFSSGVLAFRAADPTLDVTIWAPDIAADVTGKSVTKGTQLQIGIVTNQYAALSAPRVPVGTSTADGYININVRTESGAVLSQLYTQTGFAPTYRINVTTQPYYWGMTGTGLDNATAGQPGVATPWSWNTAATSGGQPQYAPGTYTVWADSLLNNMKSRYTDASGAAYTGKTVSAVKTITLVSDTVKITVNKDSVVRSKPFSVTITGRPSAYYCVWLKGVSSLDSAIDDQPPLLAPFQAGIVAGDAICGAFPIQNSGNTVSVDVSHNVPPSGNDLLRWANVSTTTSGTRTVGFETTNNTKAQKYTVMVQALMEGQYKTDQVDVKVEKGAVTIVAAGDQSYYLGEEVKFSGTNTESFTTYLFIIGPNLAPNGAQLNEPRTAVPDSGANMENADVASDNTWSYKWGTSSLQLDAGTYTIYAVSQPVNKQQLSAVAYGTVSVIIKKPFVSATASQSTVAQGDKLFITGTAEGQPSSGVAIWIMGKNYAFRNTATVESDSTFKYEIKQGDTQNLYAGQYFVVVQHPMQNDVFDITTDPQWAGGQITSPPAPSNVWVVNKQLGNQTANPVGTRIFLLYGGGALQGSDAAEALVQAINDPNVDDTYTKLQFLVETGVINIVPIGDKHVGDKFTIKALTNLAVDDEILVQVYSSSFKPTQKSQSGEFSGATGTVKVTKGDSGMNTISFDVDASTFKPDEYIVQEEAVIQGTTGSALFNVLEGAAPTAVPTPVPTTAAPTTVATPVPTTVPPTPTPTKSPGYGALIALIGLGAVAFIVVRRH